MALVFDMDGKLPRLLHLPGSSTENPAAPGSPGPQGRAARAPNAEQLLCFMTCFTLNSFPPLEPHPSSAFASSFDQPVFHRALPGCGSAGGSDTLRGAGAGGCPGSPRLHGAASRLCHLQWLWGVHGLPCCHCLLKHPELSPPGEPTGSGLSPTPHGGQEWIRMGPGGQGLLKAQLLCQHGTAWVGSALFPGGEMGTAAAC